jgi:hypothetical protein
MGHSYLGQGIPVDLVLSAQGGQQAVRRSPAPTMTIPSAFAYNWKKSQTWNLTVSMLRNKNPKTQAPPLVYQDQAMELAFVTLDQFSTLMEPNSPTTNDNDLQLNLSMTLSSLSPVAQICPTETRPLF